MSVTSKKARAKKRLSARRFVEILAKGGRIHAHPDTIASLKLQLGIVYPNTAHHRGHVELIADRYMPIGQLVAVAPMPEPPPYFAPLPPNPFTRPLAWYRGR